MIGKSINLFLPFGTTAGVIRCSLTNWIGVVYRVPRVDLDKGKDRAELNYSGVYFLLGTSDDTGRGAVYVGQARTRKLGSGVLYRLQEHRRNAEKDYWTEALVLTTINDSFGPTEISYLENRFYNLAVDAHRYDVKNGNDPNPGKLTEARICEMEDYKDQALLVIRSLGYTFLDPVVVPSSDGKAAAMFCLKRTIEGGETVAATGVQTENSFVVMKGSKIASTDTDSIPHRIREERLRAKLDENNTLAEDLPFSSPSYAAMFVIGRSANGQTAWKTAEGLTLKAYESGMSSD